MLFHHQKELSTIDFSHLALTLGLEIYQFETSREQEKHRRRVHFDYESGVRNEVTGTPTLFINGRKYTGPLDAAAIIAASQAAPSHPA